MEVILREDVRDVGQTGDVVNVSRGYARNYLIPQQLAVVANRRNLGQLEHQKRLLAKRAEKQRAAAASLAERLEGLSVTVAKPVGGNDKLYGSVTGRDVAAALVDEGVSDVNRKQVALGEPIRQLGIYDVEIKLAGDHRANIKVWVVAKV
jgi:large subunit ribosomal protein L9